MLYDICLQVRHGDYTHYVTKCTEQTDRNTAFTIANKYIEDMYRKTDCSVTIMSLYETTKPDFLKSNFYEAVI